MHRTDRFFFQPFSRWFPARLFLNPRAQARAGVPSSCPPSSGALPVHVLRPVAAMLVAAVLVAAPLSTGCTLITDVDRSKIPAAEVLPPPASVPEEPSDAGAPPATEADAGSGADAGDDAGTAIVSDAG